MQICSSCLFLSCTRSHTFSLCGRLPRRVFFENKETHRILPGVSGTGRGAALLRSRKAEDVARRQFVIAGFSRISAAYVAGYLDSMQTSIRTMPLSVVVSSPNPEELQAMRSMLGGIGRVELHQDHSAWSSVLTPSVEASWVIQDPEECRALLEFMRGHCLLRSWEASRLLGQ